MNNHEKTYSCTPFRSCSLFGALRYFCNISNSVILIHGPSGCSFFNRNAMIRLNGYYSAKHVVPVPHIYCTDFDENDVIFGGTEKVKNALSEIIEKLSPEVVFVMNCCVSEIIGEDIDNIAVEFTRRYGIRVIPVHSAGFKGDHKYGMKMASEILFREFIDNENPRRSMCVNILGDLDYFNHTSQELIRVLNEAGVASIHLVPGNCSINELQHVSEASLNIITCGNASRHLAQLFYERFQIPFIGDNASLFGIENTYNTYCKIFDTLNLDKAMLDKKRQCAQERLQQYLPFFKGKSAVIVSGTRRALGYAEIFKNLGIEIKLIFSEFDPVYTDQKDFMKYSQNVFLNYYPNDMIRKIEDMNPNFIFSTLSELVAPYKYIARTDDDFAGFDGVERMAKHLITKFEEGEKLFVKIIDGGV